MQIVGGTNLCSKIGVMLQSRAPDNRRNMLSKIQID
jgi:hypothetical protein